MLRLFQEEFNISSPSNAPIFPAGTADSRDAILDLTSHPRDSPSAWIDIYYPVLNTPLNRSLEILGVDGQATWSADLEEDGDPLDPEAAKYKDSVPAFHGLSSDGDVEGQLIYANYGSKEDYDELVASGASLAGKIVIVRYGGIFRGLKVRRPVKEFGGVDLNIIHRY
jgi:N-acetylated-alpha-linked acidic dipeptidase